jgi:hypothetical protein
MSQGVRTVRAMLRIDCADCIRQATETCKDCLVTFLCSREPDDAVVIDVAEARALHVLAGAGLVPKLRHLPKTG